MDYYRFFYSCAGFNLNDGWFIVVGSVFKTDPKQIIIVASKEIDNCIFDKIEQLDHSSYKIFIKDITREYINQKVEFKFHIIYQTTEGKLLKQTMKYGDKVELSFPEEINLK